MEISQSGKGIHAIFKGKIPGKRRRKGNYEMYESGRFFALTGDVIGEPTIQSLNESEMKVIYERIFGKDKIINVTDPAEKPINNLSISEIINQMYNSSKGQRDKLFMQGGWESFYPSQSEADLAFANDLAFWTGKDFQKMDTIFRNSALIRDKWDEKHGATTYGTATLNRAINDTVNTFSTDTTTSGTNSQFKFNKPKQKKKTPPRSWDDMGTAQRFLDNFPNDFRYSGEDNDWYIYNGSYWSRDTNQYIQKAADQVIDSLKKEKVVITDEEDQKKAEKQWQKFIKKERSHTAKESLLKELEHLVPIQHKDFDRKKMILNTPSGYVDLTDGTLHDHDYKRYFTQEVGIDYSDNVDCPMWKEFLDQTFSHDQELIHFIQKAVGYSLTGSISEQVMFVLLGNGRNGKSVFLNICQYVLGTYVKAMNASTIMKKQIANSGPSSDIARLQSARMVISSEANEGDRLDESMIKQVIGGDPVVARYPFGRDFEFNPEFKLWMATNHMPKIYGTDEGIWRRLLIIPFLHTVAKENVDKNLEDKLKSESMGILKWAIDGVMMWQSEGLGEPPAIVKATDESRKEMDVVQAFIDEECTTSPAYEIKASELFVAYKKWANETNNYEMSNTKFGTEITKHFKKVRKSVGRCYIGIDLSVNKRFSFNN
jgi:putative DNA primase/helicase